MTIHLIGGREGTGKSTLFRALTEFGFPAIDADTYAGLSGWSNIATGKMVPPNELLFPLDEGWERSHTWIWDPGKMQDLIKFYEGRDAFLCGSRTANEEVFYPQFGLRFYLWAQDGVILRRLQERDPTLWHYGSRELTNRLVTNDQSRTEAITSGSIVLPAEWAVDQLVDVIIAYVGAARSHDAPFRFGQKHV